jgi:WD40 repeat protein
MILKGHDQSVLCVRFRVTSITELLIEPKGNTLFTGSSDTTIKKWTIDDGKCEATLKGHTADVNNLNYWVIFQFIQLNFQIKGKYNYFSK